MRVSRLPIAIGISLFLLTGVADATSTTCATSTVCAEFINSSSGVAIHGEANNGIGIRGTSNTSTGFYGASRSGDVLFPGVEGESLNPGENDAAGAFGLTALTGGTAPGYGVYATGSNDGVFGSIYYAGTISYDDGGAYGTLVAGRGIFGFDLNGFAGEDANVGVDGETVHGTGVIGLARDRISTEAPFYGEYPTGVLGEAEPDQTNGFAFGVEAVSNMIPLVAYNPSTGFEMGGPTPNYAIFAANYAAHPNILIFTLDNSGNINAASLTTTQGTYARTTGASGTARTLYTPHTASPVTEDFGEGQLVNGRGYVRLDPALADVIDNRNAYHVFLTPEGDSNELYVTQKSQAGFVVREAHGGRSTLAFEYRILAKPVNENGVRLAVAPPLPRADTPLPRARPHRSNGRPPLPLDPFARLKLKLGPAGYARALAAARQNQIGR